MDIVDSKLIALLNKSIQTALCILLLIQLSCSNNAVKTNIDDEHDPGGQYVELPPSYSYMDIFPVNRPNSDDVLFVRYAGDNAPSGVTSGIYILDIATKSTRRIIRGDYGRCAWINSNVFYTVDNNNSNSLLLYMLDSQYKCYVDSIHGRNLNTSRDGSYLLVEKSEGLYVYNLGNLDQEVQYIGCYRHGCLSYSGNHLVAKAYASNGYSSNIIGLSLSGGATINYTNPQQYIDYDWPHISNNMTHITYEKVLSMPDTTRIYNIYYHDINSNVNIVVSSGRYPSFSYDDNYIYYSSWNEYLEMRIYEYDIACGITIQLTK